VSAAADPYAAEREAVFARYAADMARMERASVAHQRAVRICNRLWPSGTKLNGNVWENPDPRLALGSAEWFANRRAYAANLKPIYRRILAKIERTAS